VLRAALALGVLLVLLGSGTVAYAQWAEWQHVLSRPARPEEPAAPQIVAPAATGASATAGAVAALAPGEAGLPIWLEIARIQVDAPVVEMGVEGGEYQVPSFDVGHHADSARPGELGNSIYNGHLQTINAGRVFARLHELRVGDPIRVYTRTHRVDWVVEAVRTVPNTEQSFLQPSTVPRITLYTCEGTFDLRTRDYTHRRVVVGKLVEVTARS
jgi:LPXTG-site transpeptidase (sortase) family protein